MYGGGVFGHLLVSICIGLVVVLMSKHCCIADMIFDDQCMVMAGDDVYVVHVWYGRYWMT